MVPDDSDSVTVRIPRSHLGSQPLGIRPAELTPWDIETILGLEAIAFAPKETGTLDPPETSEGIERFLRSGGEVLLLSRVNGFLERISLENLLSIAYEDLPLSSPLRQIAERKDLLDRAKSAYSPTGKELWYVHGVGTVIRPIGDGKNLLKFLVQEQSTSNRVYFSYIDIGPTRDNINIASFRLFLNPSIGAVIDGYELEVYSNGVPYLRVSHGANHQLDKSDTRVVDLSKRNYKYQIRTNLAEGYLGVEINLDRTSGTYSMVFHKKVA